MNEYYIREDYDQENGVFYTLLYGNREAGYCSLYLNKAQADDVALTLNTETASLRAELAKLKAENARLKDAFKRLDEQVVEKGRKFIEDMKIYTVYYATKEHAHYGAKDTPFSLNTINETHRLVRVVEAKNLDHVFHMMQSDYLSPSELPDGVTHTNMSVGDCVQDSANQWYECISRGWRKMNEKSEDE